LPRQPTPYFQVYAAELLTDEKIEELSNEELGILLRLWSKMWVNGVERGTLLREQGVPISDEKLAEFLRLSLEQWTQTKDRLVVDVKVLKLGENGELYSSRMRNFKTKWELYGDEKESKKKRKRKIPEKYLTTSLASSSASSLAKIKEPAPPAGDVDKSVENSKPDRDQNSKKVEDFLSGKTGFGQGGKNRDREFRDEVKKVCLAVIDRCRQWGDEIGDENEAVNKIFGMMMNLMRYGVAQKPKGVLHFRGHPTDVKVALELVAALSKKRPEKPIAELIDAFRKQPQYRR